MYISVPATSIWLMMSRFFLPENCPSVLPPVSATPNLSMSTPPRLVPPSSTVALSPRSIAGIQTVNHSIIELNFLFASRSY